MPDMVNHPPHYNEHPSGIECIDIVEHMSFNLGNAIKYIWRADLKGGDEDLEKAIWYLDRELRRRERARHPLVKVHIEESEEMRTAKSRVIDALQEGRATVVPPSKQVVHEEGCVLDNDHK